MQCRILIWKSNTGTEHGGYSHTSIAHLGCNKAHLPFPFDCLQTRGQEVAGVRANTSPLLTTTRNDQNGVNNSRPPTVSLPAGQCRGPPFGTWAITWYMGHYGPLRSMRATTWYNGPYRLHGSLDNHTRGSITGCRMRLSDTVTCHRYTTVTSDWHVHTLKVTLFVSEQSRLGGPTVALIQTSRIQTTHT